MNEDFGKKQGASVPFDIAQNHQCKEVLEFRQCKDRLTSASSNNTAPLIVFSRQLRNLCARDKRGMGEEWNSGR